MKMQNEENPYLLLTPGPLSTTPTVKKAMLKDWCTWDADYNDLVQVIRGKIESMASGQGGYSSVLMQGSGTFSVEAAVGSLVPIDGKVIILANGAYGERIAKIAKVLQIAHEVYRVPERQRHDAVQVQQILENDEGISHLIMVHCETTTGMLNDIAPFAALAAEHGKVFMLDAMSSFGGIPLDMGEMGIDVLISSANKCIQGVPGFGFVIARQHLLAAAQGRARSLSLDLYDQWKTMNDHHGKWRFTSPTHTVRAFYQALMELEKEGGVEVRYQRYCQNHHELVSGMSQLGFECYLPASYQSPIITSYIYPDNPDFQFDKFYHKLKELGFVIYPGKVTDAATFRIGNIGNVYPEQIQELLRAIQESMYWNNKIHSTHQ